MKHIKYLCVSALFSLSLYTTSQETSDTIKLWTRYPGYIITHDDDTIHGNLLLKNKISNQGKVFFFDNAEAEEPVKKYKPRDIRAYKVANRVYETKKHSPEYTTMRYSFLLKVVNGPVSLYKSFYDDKQRIKINEDDIWKSKIDFSFSEDELQEEILGCRQGKKLEDFTKLKYLLKFNKSMSKYLSDCPKIAEKIRNKEEGYQWGDLEKIVKEYNEWYMSNN